jgi:hypothetical protein
MIERENAKQEEVQAMNTEQLKSPIVRESKTNPDLVSFINEDKDGGDKVKTHMNYQTGYSLTEDEAKNVALVTVLAQKKAATQLNLYVLFEKEKSYFLKIMDC